MEIESTKQGTGTTYDCDKAVVSGSVEYIQLLSTGTKAHWDDICKHFVSRNGRFHISLDSAINRNDVYIHYR